MALLSGNAQKVATYVALGFLGYLIFKQGPQFANVGSLGPHWKRARPSGAMTKSTWGARPGGVFHVRSESVPRWDDRRSEDAID